MRRVALAIPCRRIPAGIELRRIEREAGSVYRINGREVRARDVQLLFADASTGSNSPALVRQGQISELIAAKPQNRRMILEEAAGVSGLQWTVAAYTIALWFGVVMPPFVVVLFRLRTDFKHWRKYRAEFEAHIDEGGCPFVEQSPIASLYHDTSGVRA